MRYPGTRHPPSPSPVARSSDARRRAHAAWRRFGREARAPWRPVEAPASDGDEPAVVPPTGRRGRPSWQGRRRHADRPPGAAIAASIFHLAGTGGLADEGYVRLAAGPLYYTLLLVGPLALVWRRRFPIGVLVVATAASILFATFAEPYWMYAVAPAIALFNIAKLGRPAAAAIAAATAWAGYLLVTVALAGPLGLPAEVRPDLREIVLAAVGPAASILLGSVSRVRAAQMAALAHAHEERERAREEQQRRRASEERLRIAQELHDVLGHHLSLINVQAGVGLHLMDDRPEQAREALTAIKTASAEALREVRSVLGSLRTKGEEAPRQPAPGLSRLADLTAGAGFPLRTWISGTPRVLPAEVDRAAYRIVQEALTNIRRHAGPDPKALLEIDYGDGHLHLTITNTTRTPARSDLPGGGLTGMRARAESLGGRVHTRADPDDGFQVFAVLAAQPLPAAIPDPAEPLPVTNGPSPSPFTHIHRPADRVTHDPSASPGPAPVAEGVRFPTPPSPPAWSSRLHELAADAGLPVKVWEHGERREIPADVERVVCRIVREALANARRHAGPDATAVVDASCWDDSVHVAVVNSGDVPAHWPPAGSAGDGIAGMRAWAESLGGHLLAGPGPYGGFAVSVVLSTEPQPSSVPPYGPPSFETPPDEWPVSPMEPFNASPLIPRPGVWPENARTDSPFGPPSAWPRFCYPHFLNLVPPRQSDPPPPPPVHPALLGSGVHVPPPPTDVWTPPPPGGAVPPRQGSGILPSPWGGPRPEQDR
ncbi:histidine kinase [Actinoplanes utahensis]|uniref:histidine kinase n=1 Tax=Actinoplanes utahensis TaxID=1869 RepID=UPI0031F110AA